MHKLTFRLMLIYFLVYHIKVQDVYHIQLIQINSKNNECTYLNSLYLNIGENNSFWVRKTLIKESHVCESYCSGLKEKASNIKKIITL